MSYAQFCKQQQKAELIKQALIGNPRVPDLLAQQSFVGQLLSERFWEPQARRYGYGADDDDDDDDEEDNPNKVPVDPAEVEDLIKAYKRISERKRAKEQDGEEDEEDEEESDDGAGGGKPGEGQEGRKARQRSRRAMARCEEVNTLLRKAGIEKPEGTSKCMRAGLAKGYYGKFTGEAKQLDKVIWTGPCLTCKTTREATARELLSQPDYAGLDYEDGGSRAVIRCSKDCAGLYVTSLCDGKPQADSGKFHNHCRACPGLGKCIRDYREEHCNRCGDHYFAGMSGFPCPCSQEKQLLKKAKAGDRYALAALFFRVANPPDAEDDEADMRGAGGEDGGQGNCTIM